MTKQPLVGLRWWMKAPSTSEKQNTNTAEKIGIAAAGYARIETDLEDTRVRYSEQDSDNSSEEGNKHNTEEFFDPDPYDEASEATETEFFALRR